MTQLFPMIQPEAAGDKEPLPLYREVAWDFDNGHPFFRDGEPIVIEGAAAVRVWAWKALVTQRMRFPIYTWHFGSEIESLIGQNYTEQLKRTEAVRYAREALEINPYITEISDISTSFEGDRLRIEATLHTVYGEVTVSV